MSVCDAHVGRVIRKQGKSWLRMGAAAAIALSLLGGLAGTAKSAGKGSHVVFESKFEAPTYVAGQALVGQDGFTAPGILSPNAAVVSKEKPTQGKQSVHVWGGDLEHQDFINDVTAGYYDAIGSYRRPINYDTGGDEIIRVSAHVRIDGAKTADGDNFFSASIGALTTDVDGSPSTVGELAISSDGHAYGYSGQDLVPTFLTSTPITLNAWHNLAIEANFSTRTYTFFVDDQNLGTFDFDPSAATDLLLRTTMLTYAAPDTATLKKADYSSSFDDLEVRALPAH